MQLRDALQDTLRAASACEVDEDCQALHPPCEHWSQVECYYAANLCFTDALLSEFDAASTDCTTVGTMTYTGCTCGEAPQVRCSDGACVAD